MRSHVLIPEKNTKYYLITTNRYNYELIKSPIDT